MPQVFAVEAEQVEGLEPGLATPEQQVAEPGLAVPVEACDPPLLQFPTPWPKNTIFSS